jgi:hypothetical protein
VLRVHYAWHPQHEQDVIVHGSKKGKKSVLRCQVDDDDKRDHSEIPAWMFDQARCSGMWCSSTPRVSWEGLLELRRLLDDTAREHAAELVNDRFSSALERTDAAATQTMGTSTEAGRAVRKRDQSANLVATSRRCSTDHHGSTGQDAEAGSASTNRVPGAGGGA